MLIQAEAINKAATIIERPVITTAMVMALVEVPVDLPLDISFDSVDTTGVGDALFRVMVSLVVTTALAMFAVTRLPRSGLFQRLVLADEVLTPDCSRYWPMDGYEPVRRARPDSPASGR